MGVYQRLVNHDRIFSQLRNEPIIVNDIDESTEEERDKLNKLIYTKFTEDLLSNMPSCNCGTLTGEWNVGSHSPVICKVCNHPVKSPTEHSLEPILWMRAPKGVRALINPTFWAMLSEKFTRSGFSIIRWVCDKGYSPAVKTPPVIPVIENMLKARGLDRGYNNFIDNFHAVMDVLFSTKGFKPKKGQRDELQILIEMYPDCLFSQYAPLPNKSILVIEENNNTTYVDPIITGGVNAIRTMVGIDCESAGLSRKVRENRTVKTIDMFAEFYDGIYRDTFAKKEGIFRKHVFGTRSHFSFRAVISSLTDVHMYDEIHVPWGIGVSVFRIHLMNKLVRRGFTVNECMGFLNAHASRFHPLLAELFTELIAECPYKGIPVVFQRNPSLERGSAQLMYITQVKFDVNIPTVSLPILSVVGFNADFDGDQLNGTLSLDHVTAEQLKALAPHESTLDLKSPRNVAKNLSMPKTVVATIANWLDGGD